MRSAVLHTHGKAIERLVRAHFLGLEWMRDNAIDARHRLARRFGLAPEEAFTPFVGLVFPPLTQQRDWLERMLADSVATIAGLLQRAGLLHAAAPPVPASARFLPHPSP